MKRDNNFWEEYKHQALLTLVLLIFAIFLGMLTSCKSSKEVEYITKTDTVVNVINKRDSVMLHDSIYEKEYINGDTVYLYKYIERVRYNDILLHDSIYINRTDTVTKKVEVTKRSFFNGLSGVIFEVSIIALVVTGVILYRKS